LPQRPQLLSFSNSPFTSEGVSLSAMIISPEEQGYWKSV
jgi:hypothetical protein